jgi:hypothetical protein
LAPSLALTTMTTTVNQAAGGAHAITDGSVTDGLLGCAARAQPASGPHNLLN